MNTKSLQKLAQQVVKTRNVGNRTTNIVKVNRPEGVRHYSGTAFNGNSNFRKSQATFNAMLKARNNPADSTTVRQLALFRGDKR